MLVLEAHRREVGQQIKRRPLPPGGNNALSGLGGLVAFLAKDDFIGAVPGEVAGHGRAACLLVVQIDQRARRIAGDGDVALHLRASNKRDGHQTQNDRSRHRMQYTVPVYTAPNTTMASSPLSPFIESQKNTVPFHDNGEDSKK